MSPSHPTPVSLRPSSPEDQRRAFEWATRSDATEWMMGAPRFPDHPVTTWEEFAADYHEGFFHPRGDGIGRVLIIESEGRDVGCISYSSLDGWCGWAEIDLWIAHARDWGRGIGRAAITALTEALFRQPGVRGLLIRPSARNGRAIACYRACGFTPLDPARHSPPAWALRDFDHHDAVILVRPRGPAA